MTYERTILLTSALALTACAGRAEGAERAVHAPPPSVAAAPAEEPITGRVLSIAQDPPTGRPDATVDLASDEGAALVHATWRWVDAAIDEIDAHAAGPDRRATGPAVRTHDLSPRPGQPSWDTAAWGAIAPSSLEDRRGTSHLSFGWYRVTLELPERVGETEVRGSTIAFEIVVDDYAEVWVDGQHRALLGERGGPVVAGFNAPNRVVLTHDAVPGTRYDVAVLAANGPFGESPENFVWVRSATLDVVRAPRGFDARATLGHVERVDPRLDAIVPAAARLERVATGFDFTEGPVWTPEGTLLFSDPNANLVYRFDPVGRLDVFRSHSGYAGVDVGRYHQPGSNGLAIDAEGRVVVCEHGRRRVVRIERNGSITVLADRFEGRRLSSPNDVVVGPDGAVWFTDPPFGLPGVFEDPAKELDFSGVFRVAPDGAVTLVSRELTGPNGIAFSPDGAWLYVSNWDVARRVVLRWPVQPDGSVGEPTTFVDLTASSSDEALDGLEVDEAGNLYVSAPEGVRIHAPDGTHLGTIHVVERPANMAWGGDDGRTLYLTAHSSVYRVELAVAGAHRHG